MPCLLRNAVFLVMAAGALLASAPASNAADLPVSARYTPAADVSAALDLAYRGDRGGAENALRALLKEWPEDYDVQFSLARVLAWQGAFEEASALVESLRRQNPGNDDVKILVARLAYYQGDLDRSQSLFADVSQRQPKGADALVGLGDIQWARQKDKEARAWFLLASQYAPHDMDIQARVARPERKRSAAKNWRTHTGLGYSQLSRDVDNIWREQTINLQRSFAKGWSLGAQVENRERYGEQDVVTRFEVFKTTQNSNVYGLAVGATKTPNFSERVQIRGHASIRLASSGQHPSMRLNLAARYVDYETGSVEILTLGLLYPLNRSGTSVTPSWTLVYNENDEADHGGTLRLDHRLTRALTSFAGMSDQPETERGVTLRTRSAFAGLSWDVNDALSLRANYLYEDRSGSYVRNGFGVALIGRF